MEAVDTAMGLHAHTHTHTNSKKQKLETPELQNQKQNYNKERWTPPVSTVGMRRASFFCTAEDLASQTNKFHATGVHPSTPAQEFTFDCSAKAKQSSSGC
jgi:Tat protein secretion system quality control protein TatD with DNase activity